MIDANDVQQLNDHVIWLVSTTFHLHVLTWSTLQQQPLLVSYHRYYYLFDLEKLFQYDTNDTASKKNKHNQLSVGVMNAKTEKKHRLVFWIL